MISRAFILVQRMSVDHRSDRQCLDGMGMVHHDDGTAMVGRTPPAFHTLTPQRRNDPPPVTPSTINDTRFLIFLVAIDQ